MTMWAPSECPFVRILLLLALSSLVRAMSTASNRFITNKMCPYAQKAWIALELSKTPYRLEEVSLYGANGKPDWFWDLSPGGTVPVLVYGDEDLVLPDSDLILNEIEQRNPSLQPQTESERKQNALWRQSIAKLLPIGKRAVFSGNTKELFRLLHQLDEQVTSPYLCGPRVLIADCAAFPFLWRIENEFGLDGCEQLADWLNVCRRNRAFSKTIQRSWWWWW